MKKLITVQEDEGLISLLGETVCCCSATTTSTPGS